METFSALSLISIFLLQTLSGAYSTTLTITNNCDDIIWPAILPNPGSQLLLSPSGFALSPGDSKTLPGPVPSDWSGRVWARTQCATSPTGAFLCATGDCGTSTVDCSGSGAGAGQPTPPATVAEFSPGALSVSVVDGYNLPIVVSAGACGTASCVINSGAVYYPPELRASGSGAGNESVGIKSACSAFNEAEYCCTGNYSSASSCKANSYSELFKKWCPQARTYAYDTVGTTFACESADYVVNFCSPANFVFPSTDGTRSG